MIQPYIKGSGRINCTVSVWNDFQFGTLESNLHTLNPGGLFWDEVPDLWEAWQLLWGNEAGGPSNINLSANVIGNTFAVALDADTNQTLEWYSTNLTLQAGGII